MVDPTMRLRRALLHDAVEDGGADFVDRIRALLGEDVLRIVLECSDSVVPKGDDKPLWKERKLTYLAAIPTKSPEAIRVTIADKLHNARAIVAPWVTRSSTSSRPIEMRSSGTTVK
jgi:(p)ppGpp synthase/HD superfamily hydrolase